MRRLRVDVSKNFSTAASSQEGELDTSTTTDAPFSTSASPSPVRVLTPEFGDAATASCPCSRSSLTSFDPMSPLPPMTTIFMFASLVFDLGISSQASHHFGCAQEAPSNSNLRSSKHDDLSFAGGVPSIVCQLRPGPDRLVARRPDSVWVHLD